MAGTTQLRSQWRCLTRGCTAAGEDTAAKADKAAEKHQKASGHATLSWSEPTLPVRVPGAARGR